ncbi:MAG: FkbM family methyltransferase [Actinomycetota bacterium]
MKLRLGRLRLTHRRVCELTETRTGRLRLWLCLFAGLVEYYVGPARSDRLRRVRVGRGSNARDLYLRANGVDVYTFYATFIKGLYDAVLPLPQGAVVVDLGANIGITGAYWLTVCHDARVVAVEPESGNVALLRMNLQAPGVSIHQTAISERCGTEFLEIRGVTGHTLVADESEGRGEVQAVRTITLDDLEAMERLDHVDVVKVDIEGAEVPVFTQPWRLLRKCDGIVMEIHDADRRSDLVHCLAEQGFSHRVGERVDFPDVFSR